MASYVTLANVGRVVVWGTNTNRQIAAAPRAPDFIRLAQGGRIQSLAMRQDRTLELWPIETEEEKKKRIDAKLTEKPVPALSALAGVPCYAAALGLEHVVGIRADDRTLVTDGSMFVSGTGGVPATLPVLAPPGPFESVATAGGHGLAMRRDGTLAQWGSGPAIAHAAPTGHFMKIRARSSYSLALRRDGVLFGWGGWFDAFDLASDPLWDDWQSDNQGHWLLEGPFSDLAAGNIQQNFKRGGATIAMPHVIALHEGGKVEGWGANSNGETASPAGKFQTIAAGNGYSIGLDEDGFLHQWGRSWEQTVMDTTKPAPPNLLRGMPKGKFFSISAASNHATAVKRGVAVSVGPDFHELVTRQGRMESFGAQIAGHQVLDALQIVRQAVADWRHAPSSNPDDHIRREQQLREFDRLAEDIREGAGLELDKVPG